MEPQYKVGNTTEQPVTEQSNLLSVGIDVALPEGIASILYACDQEIFKGWKNSKGVNNMQVLQTMQRVALKMSEIIQNPSTGAVVISGCGTSGRIAFLTARAFNRYLQQDGKQGCFKYIIAGKDEALFRSIELSEDDPLCGAQSLEEASRGKSKIVYIGVTCGLSAPFVAGQLDHCLSHLDKYTPVLLGFNPAHQARNLSIEKWDKTFLQVVQEMEAAVKSSQAFILNPVIGPEPITGSSRMKSGTTTKIMLEVMSIVAKLEYPQQIIDHLMSMYETACHSVYKHTDLLGKLIQLAGSCLKSSGHIYYLGCDAFGLMAMIDASECTPTFGASFDDIRGFVDGGFACLQNNDGDISSLNSQYRISIDNFEEDIVPSLQPNDLVIVLGEELLNKVSSTLSQASCKKVCVLLELNKKKPGNINTKSFETFKFDLKTPALESLIPEAAKVLMRQLLLEVSLKWIVNNISTGAHILKGKVYHNIMIDVRVSNNKLYHRALGIVQKYCGLSIEESRECLLKSIYNTESLTDEQKSAPVVEHILAARDSEKVVPTAILLSTLQCTVDTAKKMIQKQPVLRKLFDKSV